MKKIGLASVLLSIVAVAPAANAQCPPGSWLCADIQIGGSISPPPPPPPVVVAPPPPQVIVVRPPPRVYVTTPPVVVYQPAPQPVYYQQPVGYYAPPAPRRRGVFGLQGSLVGSPFVMPGTNRSTGDQLGLIGGFNAGIRLRNHGHFGGEFAVGIVGGRDYNGDNRLEIPFTLTGMVYFNPQHRFQVFGLAGIGASVADVRYANDAASSLVSGTYATNVDAHGGRRGANYAYLGGHAGIGAELQISPRFSMFADTRVFVRGRIDDDTRRNPEYARNVGGSTQTTNVSVGMSAQLGAILYF